MIIAICLCLRKEALMWWWVGIGLVGSVLATVFVWAACDLAKLTDREMGAEDDE
jgi:hypothetical protein